MTFLAVLFTMNMPKVYESTASIFTDITMGESMIQGKPDLSVQNALYDNMSTIITGRETLKETGLRLLSLHLCLKQANPRIISAEHLDMIHKKVPPDIKNLISETDSITFLKLNEIADTHIFLIHALNLPQIAYYSYETLSTISVTRVGNSDMFSLSYSCDDPGVCQKTLEILIDVCIRNYRKIREGQLNRKVAFFEKQVQIAQENLKYAEAEEEQFKKNYGTTDLSIQTGLTPKDITNQIQKEQKTLSAIGTDISYIEEQWKTQTQSLKRADITQKKDQLSKLLNQLITAELTNAPSSRITRLRTEVNRLKTDLTNDLTENMTPATSVTEYINKIAAYEGSKARIKVLENRKLAVEKPSGKPLPPADTLKRIQRDIDSYEKDYQTALEDLSESRRQQQDQLLSSAIQALDKPNFPLTAERSNRPIWILLGAFAGFILPLSFLLLKAGFNNNIRTPQRAEKATGLITAGIIPNTQKLLMLKNHGQITNGLNDVILKNLFLTDNKTGQVRVLILSTRPLEGKTLVSNMLCERLLEKGSKCLVVTPFLDSGSWSVVSYKASKFSLHPRASDIAHVEKINDADILIIELPSLITNDYPVELIKQFNTAFLVCRANRKWGNADQNALDNFISISGISPQIILNDTELDMVEEMLGKII